jgi:hypothetical protein
MRNRRAGGAKLTAFLVGGLALFAVDSASAGLLLAEDALGDFRFDGSRVNYSPSFSDLRVVRASGVRLGVGSHGGAESMEPLYFSGDIPGSGASELTFDVERSVAKGDRESPPELLKGAQHILGGGNGSGQFDILVKGGRISGELAGQFGGRGVYVSVAGLESSDWLDIYRRLSNPVKAQSEAERSATTGAAGPSAAPVPATWALLLAVGLPLVLLKSRS